MTTSLQAFVVQEHINDLRREAAAARRAAAARDQGTEPRSERSRRIRFGAFRRAFRPAATSGC